MGNIEAIRTQFDELMKLPNKELIQHFESHHWGINFVDKEVLTEKQKVTLAKREKQLSDMVRAQTLKQNGK